MLSLGRSSSTGRERNDVSRPHRDAETTARKKPSPFPETAFEKMFPDQSDLAAALVTRDDRQLLRRAILERCDLRDGIAGPVREHLLGHERGVRAAEYEERVSALVASDPALSEYVKELKRREFAQ